MASKDAKISTLVSAQMGGPDTESLKLRVAASSGCVGDSLICHFSENDTLRNLSSAQIVLENIAAAQRAVGDVDFSIAVARLSRADILAACAQGRAPGGRRRPRRLQQEHGDGE